MARISSGLHIPRCPLLQDWARRAVQFDEQGDAAVTASLDSKLISILSQNHWFMRVLRAVRTCDPPDWLVGGGVIRNILGPPAWLP